MPIIHLINLIVEADIIPIELFHVIFSFSDDKLLLYVLKKINHEEDRSLKFDVCDNIYQKKSPVCL